MKQSNPRTFSGLARSGSEKPAINSGIFSSDGSQKMDAKPTKPSPGGPGIVDKPKKAALNVLKAAVKLGPRKTAPGADAGSTRKSVDYSVNSSKANKNPSKSKR